LIPDEQLQAADENHETSFIADGYSAGLGNNNIRWSECGIFA
jgi:hypothetical protein